MFLALQQAHGVQYMQVLFIEITCTDLEVPSVSATEIQLTGAITSKN
jgi:hypothetical protein